MHLDHVDSCCVSEHMHMLLCTSLYFCSTNNHLLTWNHFFPPCFIVCLCFIMSRFFSFLRLLIHHFWQLYLSQILSACQTHAGWMRVLRWRTEEELGNLLSGLSSVACFASGFLRYFLNFSSCLKSSSKLLYHVLLQFSVSSACLSRFPPLISSQNSFLCSASLFGFRL